MQERGTSSIKAREAEAEALRLEPEADVSRDVAGAGTVEVNAARSEDKLVDFDAMSMLEHTEIQYSAETRCCGVSCSNRPRISTRGVCK